MDSGILWRVGFLAGVVIGATLLLVLLLRWQPHAELVPADTPPVPSTDQGAEMTLYAANGSQLTKTAATAKTATLPVTDPIVRITENLYEGTRLDGTSFPEGKRNLRFPKDALVRKSLLDACFPDAAVGSVFPASGAAAGGETVTIRGTNFTPGSTVAFGGTAATNVVVVDEKTITCRTPAKAAGAVAVQVTTDAGPFSKANAFTYA
ncbi:IPT/TIG domain-containing protein [Nonomuraea recticatena]|uniref:IPT/TIG domain-containing protein n=1 Tax=Nonomuraea recticatena TaxID=46178 RepID=A0ABN3T4B9_9ACTN